MTLSGVRLRDALSQKHRKEHRKRKGNDEHTQAAAVILIANSQICKISLWQEKIKLCRKNKILHLKNNFMKFNFFRDFQKVKKKQKE